LDISLILDNSKVQSVQVAVNHSSTRFFSYNYEAESLVNWHVPPAF